MMCVCLRAERHQRTPAETNGFWSSFTFKSFVRYEMSWELTQQQPRCRSRPDEETGGSAAWEYGLFLFATGGPSSFLSPTAYFLPTAAKSMQKMPPETDGFWTSFCVQELLPKFRRSRETAFFYSRCRYIGWLKGVVLLPGESITKGKRTKSSGAVPQGRSTAEKTK